MIVPLVSACGPTNDSAEVEEGDVDEAAWAVGEPGCATVTPDATVSSNYCSSQWAVSVSDTYHHPADCPYQFVTEFTGSVGFITGPGAAWGEPMPSTQADCVKARWEVGVYNFRSSTQAWNYTGRYAAHGAWLNGSCSWNVDVQNWGLNPDRTKVRLAGAAWNMFGQWKDLVRAKDFVFGTPCFSE